MALLFIIIIIITIGPGNDFFLLGYRIFPIIFQEFGHFCLLFIYLFIYLYIYLFIYNHFLSLHCICVHKVLCQLFRKKHFFFIKVIPFGPWLNRNC